MDYFTYNDMSFAVDKVSGGWTITRRTENGISAIVAAGLFSNLPDQEAMKRALTLVRTIYPVGIKIVGPDVDHPNKIGDLKIVGPDVHHPNFIYWNTESTSLPN